MRSKLLRAATCLSVVGLCLAVAAPTVLTPGPAAAQSALPPATGKLTIDRIQIVEAKAATYRDPALKPITSVPASSEMHIYVEPVGLATKYETGDVKGLMVIDLQLRNPAGKVIRDGKAVMRVPVSVKAPTHAPLKDVFVNIKLDPLKLAPGPYVLMIRVNDEFGRTAAEKTVSFKQTAGQVGPPATKK